MSGSFWHDDTILLIKKGEIYYKPDDKKNTVLCQNNKALLEQKLSN